MADPFRQRPGVERINGYLAGIEINANHLRAVTEGQVTGTARPIHLGRATQVWEIRLEDDKGRLT